ncbi:hypothetical protein ACFV0R_10925, partial [Streptomyces sp. NPDC059578]
MTRDDLAGMLGEQTTACGPAREALIAGGTFVVWDNPVPAAQLAGIYRARLRITQKRGGAAGAGGAAGLRGGARGRGRARRAA